MTLHPFVITLLQNTKPTTVSAVIISDELQHNTNTYFALQKTILTWQKAEYPHIEKIEYFTDGAASQYKNFKKVANLKHHKEDFGKEATHHFFASCHGKGSCDAIGGVLKCKVRRDAKAGHIVQTAEEFHRYVSEKVSSIKSF